VRSDQDIDNALAAEFSGYLKSIAKEIVQPIRDEAGKQKFEIERLNSSIDQAGSRIAALLEGHREDLSSEGSSLLKALDGICRQMSDIVQGVAAANDVTREHLMSEAARMSDALDNGMAEFRNDMRWMRDALDRSLATFHEQTKPWITQAGKDIEAAMQPRLAAAEESLQSSLDASFERNFRKLDEPLAKSAKLPYFLTAIIVLQIGSMALFWFYK
jgi:signal transduction protein with GAF and PtsI domain